MTDRVLPEVHAAVMRRDKVCILALLDKTHGVCRDRWGEPHNPTDMGKLTLEHVRDEPGGRRRSDEGHMVAMCGWANDQHAGSTTENRALLKAYLFGTRQQSRALLP